MYNVGFYSVGPMPSENGMRSPEVSGVNCLWMLETGPSTADFGVRCVYAMFFSSNLQLSYIRAYRQQKCHDGSGIERFAQRLQRAVDFDNPSCSLCR